MKILPDGKYRNLRVWMCVFSLVITGGIYFFPNLLYLRYTPHEGDIVFQSLSLDSDLVQAIEGVTESQYSHCGVVIKIQGKWYVKEAFDQVRNTELLSWIKRGRGYRIDVYRFKNEYTQLISHFIEALNKYQNLPYDFKYELNDLKIYCSELPFRAFKDITGQDLGKLTKLGDMNWQPYEQTIIRYEEGPVPLGRLMITPKNLAEAPQLERIHALGI